MKSYAICPISNKKINEPVARVNAALIVFILIIFILSGHIFLMIFLAIDFLMRTANYSKYSVLAILSKNIVSFLTLDEHLINAGPKIFAARIGFVFSSSIILTHTLGVNWLTFGLIGILGIFSLLEATFGFCVACKIYPFLYKMLYHHKFK